MKKVHRILITGATGVIGQEILRQLDALDKLDGVSVFVRNSKKNAKLLKPYLGKISVHYGDMMDKSSLIPACKNQDLVMHLAGKIPPEFHENDEQSRKINVGGTKNIIEVLEEHTPNAFLLFSSSVVVYGDRLKNPEIRVGDPVDPDQYDVYGIAKIETEKLIQESKLKWSMLRLSAIMGIGTHKVSGIMFHVPLETPMEFCTVRDTATAFVHAPDHLAELEGKIFNLGGGENCRITFGEFLGRAFGYFGMGELNFPKYSFASCNFHCGDYMDGDDLNAILHFQSDTVETYFELFAKSVPPIQRFFTRPFAGIAKWYLRTLSEPYKAYRTKDKQQMLRFFGTTDLD